MSLAVGETHGNDWQFQPPKGLNVVWRLRRYRRGSTPTGSTELLVESVGFTHG